jgi:hypothetical protein
MLHSAAFLFLLLLSKVLPTYLCISSRHILKRLDLLHLRNFGNQIVLIVVASLLRQVNAFLNNGVGVFEYEVDENGISGGKIWEWK